MAVSKVTIKVNGNEFEATYTNWVVKEKVSPIAKAPNGKVVTFKQVEVDKIKEGKKHDKVISDADTKNVYVDDAGTIYESKDIKFFNAKGKEVVENEKTEVFVGEDILPIADVFDVFAFEAYYKVTPVDVSDKGYKAIYEDLKDGEVALGVFNLISKGFNISMGALRVLKDGNFEMMVCKGGMKKVEV